MNPRDMPDIVATQGAHLITRGNTPVLEEMRDANFAVTLAEKLRGIVLRYNVRHNQYRGEGDEFPLGHTPPELKSKWTMYSDLIVELEGYSSDESEYDRYLEALEKGPDILKTGFQRKRRAKSNSELPGMKQLRKTNVSSQSNDSCRMAQTRKRPRTSMRQESKQDASADSSGNDEVVERPAKRRATIADHRVLSTVKHTDTPLRCMTDDSVGND